MREGESAPSCQVSTTHKKSRCRTRIQFTIAADLFPTDWAFMVATRVGDICEEGHLLHVRVRVGRPP